MITKDDILFGKIALRKSMASMSQLKECLKEQADLSNRGINRQIGSIMIHKGYLSEQQVETIFRIQQQVQGEPRKIAGFELLHTLGQGAMGSVYKARQISMDRPVAVKVLSKECAQDEEFVHRFLREARAVAKLNHPNIINGIEAGEVDGTYFLAVEFVEGTDLETLLDHKGQLGRKLVIEIGIQIANALAHAHDHGLVHRDVKPANILLTKDGVAKLADLGLSRSISPDSSTQVTMSGIALGTPLYMAPEQAKADHLDGRADIYALGATLFHLLTGQPVFDGDSSMVIMTKHVDEDPPVPSSIREDIPHTLDQVLLKMLAKDPGDRYQTGHEVAEALQAILHGRKPAVASGHQAAGKSQHATRQTTWIMLGVASVLLMLVAAWIIMKKKTGHPPKPSAAVIKQPEAAPDKPQEPSYTDVFSAPIGRTLWMTLRNRELAEAQTFIRAWIEDDSIPENDRNLLAKILLGIERFNQSLSNCRHGLASGQWTDRNITVRGFHGSVKSLNENELVLTQGETTKTFPFAGLTSRDWYDIFLSFSGSIASLKKRAAFRKSAQLSLVMFAIIDEDYAYARELLDAVSKIIGDDHRSMVSHAALEKLLLSLTSSHTPSIAR